jgi:histidinol-phosphate phosphatase family protein
MICQFDVLDADHMPYFQLFILRAVAALKRKPFVVTWHEVWSRSYWFSYLGWPGLIGWLVEWLSMRMPTAIIAASPHTAERLNTALRGRTPITTVPNGIDVAEIRSVYPDADVRDLVVVGRLFDHKRVGMLLDAVALLHARGVAVTCRIVGDGPERNALHQQARRLGVDQDVTFHHDVAEPKDVYALLKASRIFISPSAREGFGIAVLEALACGVAVVTTSAPDNLAQHLVARSARGVICEPSADGIATAVQQLLTEPGRLSPEEFDGDPWLEDYDWDLMAERVAEVYLREHMNVVGARNVSNLQRAEQTTMLARRRQAAPSTSMHGRAAVFLDRDGVLTEAFVRDGVPTPPRSMSEFRVLPGVTEACADLRQAGFVLVVITNQPDVARGAQTRAEVDQMHERLRSLVPLDEICVCPHDDPDACPCRKPKPGMLMDAAERLGLDLTRSVAVGDRWRDIEAARRAGVTAIHVDRHYAELAPVGAHVVVADMTEAAAWIRQQMREPQEALG